MSDSSLCVFHFVRDFSALSETFIYDYVTELERQGVDNHVVTLNRKNKESRPFPKVHEVDYPNRWHPLRLWHRFRLRNERRPSWVSFWPQVRTQIKNVAATVRPDVIHAHFGPAGVMTVPVAESLGVPSVTTLYGYDASQLPKKPFWREAYDGLWTQVDAVTVLSEDMEATAETFGCPTGKLNVVHLSRDLDQFPFQRPDQQVRSVLFVGRLVPKKAPLEAVQAIDQANEKGDDLSLDLVGGGPLREKVEQYVHENNLSDHVTVHGRLPNDEVGERMQTADAFLLPSKTAPDGDREGTPAVLIEAQAAGLPCVTTRHAGIPEMVPEENHDLLAPEGDVQALANSLVRLSSLSVDQLAERAQRGRRKVEQEFSVEAEAEVLRGVYRKIATSHA